MEKQNYAAAITVDASPKEVFESITNVSKWWSENFEGSSQKPDDIFSINFGGETFVDFKVIEVIINKKLVWYVTDCYLNWLKDKKEWKDTKVDFELSSEDKKTTLHFTHIGLSPEVECYNDCVKGWDQYIKDSLLKLITEGKGQPQLKKEMTTS